MTNLLASLVDRTLERAPVLQRRKPTFFEAGNDFAMTITQNDAGDSLREEQLFAESITSVTDRPTAEIREAPLSYSPEDSQAPHRPVSNASLVPKKIELTNTPESVELHTPDVEASLMVDKIDQSTVREEPRPVRERLVSHQARTNKNEHPTETIAEKKVDREIVIHNFAREFGSEKPNLPGQLQKTTSRSIPNRVIVRRPNIAKEIAAQNDGVRLSKPPAHRRPPTIETQRTSRPRQQLEPPHEADQVKPTINVTIGRVEVRASAPTRRVEPSRPANPKLSLDDYLRERSKEN